MITKHRIDFDPTAPGDHDRVGAQLLGWRGAASQPIDSRDNSGTEELHVHDVDANSELDAITALLTTIDSDTDGILTELQALSHAEDAAHVSSDLGIMALAVRNDVEGTLVDTDGNYGSLQLDAVGRLRVVADLDFSSAVADDDPSTENPILVGAVAHDLSAVLAALSADGDKAHILVDLYRRQYVADVANIAWKATADTVDNTSAPAAELVAAPLAGRTRIEIQNRGVGAGAGQSIYIGQANTVTTATGLEIPKGATWVGRLGEAIDIFAIAPTAATQDVRIAEYA